MAITSGLRGVFAKIARSAYPRIAIKERIFQESFADHRGLHRTYIGGVEKGEYTQTLGTVLTIAKGLGMKISDLLAGIEHDLEAPFRPKKSPIR